MTGSFSPFNNPDLQAAMVEAGIVHEPGMAEQLLEELAPLLEEKGVRIDGEEVDLEKLNEAMAYATERHNMALYTPIGEQRTHALTTLQQVCHAIYIGNLNRAELALYQLGPEPANTTPSIAHVTGVSLDLLDNLFSNLTAEPALRDIKLPRWPAPILEAAKDILLAAQHRRSFASLDTLIPRHGSKAMLHAATYLVAHALAVKARKDRLEHSPLVEKYLFDGEGVGGESGPQDGAASGPTSSSPPWVGMTPEAVNAFNRGAYGASQLQYFTTWYEEQGMTNLEATEEMRFFELLIFNLANEGLDLHDPEDYPEIIEWIGGLTDEEIAEAAIEALHDYVHFRQDTDVNPGPWFDVHEYFNDLDSFEEVPEFLAEMVEEAQQVDSKDRLAAILATPIVSAIPDLLQYMGESLPITPTGAIQRKDIQAVAGMIGISAVGVSRLPHPDDLDGGVDYVQSANDINELRSWWTALQIAGIIERSPSRMYPGPNADSFMRLELLEIEEVEPLISMFVADFLAYRMISDDMQAVKAEKDRVYRAMSNILRAVKPNAANLLPGASDSVYFSPWQETYDYKCLESMGLIHVDDGQATIRPELHLAMINAVAILAAFLDSLVDPEFDM